MADDDEEIRCKVEYIDQESEEVIEETNWIKHAGRCRVTYPNGDVFDGSYDDERVKQGYGVYIWKGPVSEDDETLIEKARYEGNYVNGKKSGVGRIVYPNGDSYEGEWLEDKPNGEGTYVYKKTGDIYSGTWLNGKKNYQGRYEFDADRSMLVGDWENGQITSGSWELKNAGIYEGQFKVGRPYGPGKYTFASGLVQTGEYVEKKPTEDEPEPEVEEGKLVPPNVSWKGTSIVSI